MLSSNITLDFDSNAIETKHYEKEVRKFSKSKVFALYFSPLIALLILFLPIPSGITIEG